jgi:hypothetical protein
MTTIERLARWKDAGAITAAQHDAIAALVLKGRFSLFLELNALLYLGVLSLAGGLAWTVHTYSARVGDIVVLGGLAAVLGASVYYCSSRARPFSAGEADSPNVLFDYVLYLACLVFAIELAYAELRFELLRDAWDSYLLLSSACYFAAAYRFDNRLVLSLALSTLAGWFGITLHPVLPMVHAVRLSAVAYGALITAAGLVTWTSGLKRHFLTTYLHVAANVVFAALASGVIARTHGELYLGALLVLAAATVLLGVRHRSFAFVVYAIVYPYVAVSVEITRRLHGLTAILTYLVVSAAIVVAGMLMLARRSGRTP